jgi:amidophosphoribosyltransferase
MEKQHNRGQDGAGVACVKLDIPAGEPFMFRERSVKANPLDKIFKACSRSITRKSLPGRIHPEFPDTVKKSLRLRRRAADGAPALRHERRLQPLSSCHPYFRRSPWPTRNLALCGNFNMTNTRSSTIR